jgi:hypothetical protein
MDIQRIFNLSMKGLNLIQSLAQQGKDIKPVLTSLTNIFSKHPGQVTDEELNKAEADLDTALDEFERPMKKSG